MKNKRGLSGVVTAVILIALVMAVVAIVWVVVNNLVEGELGGAESCFGIFGEVDLNPRYTCYNSTSNKLRFSISIGDIEIDEALIGIAGEGSTISLKLSSQTSQVDNLVTYPGGSSDVRLPGKNAGLTYTLDLTGAGFAGEPDSVEIAPIINDNQCGVSDSLEEIDNCALLS